MSQSLSDFRSIFDAALEAYKKKTGKDLTSHPLLAQLTTCNSANAVLEVLRNQIPTFDQPSNKDDKLTKWLNPIVNVLYVFSATLGEGVGLVRLREAQCGSFRGPFQLIIISQAFSPGKAIFAGIGVLLLASLSIPLRDSILTPDSLRRLRTSPPAERYSLTYSNALITSLDDSRHTSISNQLLP